MLDRAQTREHDANSAASISQNGDPCASEIEEVGLSERLAEIGRRLEAEIPGAVLAIARKGKLAFLEAFGFRDKAAGVAMTTDTMFNIASMTKPVTAVAALATVRARASC